MAWHSLLSSDPQEAFLHLCSVSLVPKSWGRDPLIRYSHRLPPPLCPCHEYYLKLFLQETNTGYLLSVVTSISEGKQEADCKYLE